MYFRIGHGYDAHRLIQGRTLMLGGVRVPFDKGLLGHSDADVLAHAVADALLGAVGMGDIGEHFPDSDARFKDMPGMRLLSQTRVLIASAGYIVVNVDATVVAQQPKLKPYITEMVRNIAEALFVAETAVNIKATTEEGMGFTGSGEGIAAYAVCLLELK